MSLVAFDHIPILETREPLAELGAFPFLALPVYFRNGWAATASMFARVGVLDRLARVQQRNLAPRGWRWVVYDAWRPRELQAAIYQHYWREMSRQDPVASPAQLEYRVRTYVTLPARPERIPPHSTGGAVDVGLWDIHAGALVPMGSAFDEFCPQASNNYFEQPGRDPVLAARRRELTQWLAEEGVVSDDDEWFHKDWGTQKWAAQSDAAVAVYGEVLACQAQNGAVQVQWGADEAPDDRALRLLQLAQSLDLAHPARQRAARLPDLEDWCAALRRIQAEGTAA